MDAGDRTRILPSASGFRENTGASRHAGSPLLVSLRFVDECGLTLGEADKQIGQYEGAAVTRIAVQS